MRKMPVNGQEEHKQLTISLFNLLPEMCRKMFKERYVELLA